MANNKKNNGSSTILAIIIVLCLIGWIGNSCGSGSSSSSSNGKEQRCWYCGKVVVNSQGRTIHRTNGKCDYCGH